MARRDLWPRVEPLLSRVERPARYLNHEWGCAAPVAEGDFAFCMIYPDTYELGQANQAVRILVNAVNAMGGMGAERAFLPAVDMADLMREEGVPLFSLESCRCVGACGLAPVMMINDEVFGRMTPEQVPVILEDYARRGGVPV